MGSQPGNKQASSAVHQGVVLSERQKRGSKGGVFLRSNLGLIESGAQKLAGMSSRSGVSRCAQVCPCAGRLAYTEAQVNSAPGRSCPGIYDKQQILLFITFKLPLFSSLFLRFGFLDHLSIIPLQWQSQIGKTTSSRLHGYILKKTNR